MGDKVNFCVPTGNFGDILAAYYAKRMGLPVGKLICASNCNDVLTDFLRTGVYDKNRPFHTTMSPSMDILVSSNLERLLFDLSGENDAEVKATWMPSPRPASTKCPTPSRRLWRTSSGALLRRGGHLRCHRQVLQGERVSDRYPHRRGRQRHGTVPQGHRRQDGDGVRLHRLPLQVLRPRAAGHRGDPGGDGVELLDQLHETTGTAIPRRLAALKGQGPAVRPHL